MISNEYNPLFEAVTEAGAIVVNHFLKREFRTDTKNGQAHNLVTTADHQSQAAIVTAVRKAFPGWHIHAEEKDFKHIGDDTTMKVYIDPLDGTHNFKIGKPYFSVSLAVTENDQVIFGLVYDPIFKRYIHAEKGKGAYIDDKRLIVSNVTHINNATISYIDGYSGQLKTHEDLLRTLNRLGVKRVLTEWSPGLDFALLASGGIDAIICNDTDYHDKLAGMLIANEAGATIKDHDGDEPLDLSSKVIVTSTADLQKAVRDALKESQA